MNSVETREQANCVSTSSWKDGRVRVFELEQGCEVANQCIIRDHTLFAVTYAHDSECEKLFDRRLHGRITPKPGNLTFLPAGYDYWARVGGRIEYVAVELNCGVMARVAPKLKPDFKSNFVYQDPCCFHMVEMLAQEARHTSPMNRLAVESLTNLLLLHLLRAHGSPSSLPATHTGGLSPRTLRQVQEYVEEHLDDTIEVRTLADLSGLSLSHFATCFRQSTGSSPARYVTERRIERAKQLLKDGTEPLSTIAAETGFCDQSHLTRYFRRRTGFTPSAFRDRATD